MASSRFIFDVSSVRSTNTDNYEGSLGEGLYRYVLYCNVTLQHNLHSISTTTEQQTIKLQNREKRINSNG